LTYSVTEEALPHRWL